MITAVTLGFLAKLSLAFFGLGMIAGILLTIFMRNKINEP